MFSALYALPLVYFLNCNYWLITTLYFAMVLVYHIYQIETLNSAFKQHLGYEDLGEQDEPLSFAKLSHINPKSAIWQSIYYLLNKHQKRHEKKYTKLRTHYQDFTQAIQASPNGVMICSHQGEMLWFSSKCQMWLDLQSNDLGKQVQSLIRQPEFHAYLKQIYQTHAHNPSLFIASSFTATATGNASHNQRPLIYKNNRILKVTWGDIDAQRCLLVFQDITEVEQIEQMRKNFISDVSHELSTPLTVILGYIESLQSLDLQPATQQQFLQKIEHKALDMKALVHDLLLLTRLEEHTQIQTQPQKLTQDDVILPSNDNQAMMDVLACLDASHQTALELNSGHQFDYQVQKIKKIKKIKKERIEQNKCLLK